MALPSGLGSCGGVEIGYIVYKMDCTLLKMFLWFAWFKKKLMCFNGFCVIGLVIYLYLYLYFVFLDFV